ncbi:MAG: site-specific integrase [Thermoplasmata archaeon]
MAPKGSPPTDPALLAWYRNTANGSKITADVYRRRLTAFCRDLGTDPASLPTLTDEALRNLMVAFVDKEAGKGRARSYIESSLKAVRSWLLHHGRKLNLPVKVPATGISERLETEEIPTPAQLRAALMAATPNERLTCALMAFSGLRPGAIGNYLGTDGLRISDLMGVKVEGGRLEFPDPPLRVRVRATNSKAGHTYFTFLGEEGVEYLRTVLQGRLEKGEPLGPDSDVIHPYRTEKKFIRTMNVGDQVRLALRRAGIQARPYVLRSYFASRLLEAQNAGKVARDYTEFWMGHRGDITQRHYTTGRARLSESLVTSMREAYRRCEGFLSTTPTSQQVHVNSEAFRVLLSPWYTDEEIGKIDLGDPAAVIEALRNGAAKGTAPTGPKQQVIHESDLPRYLNEGWVARMPVNGSKFVVERA